MTDAPAPSWSDLPVWLQQSLATLHYNQYLPIQKVVVPILDRALASYLPMDVCLSAPTGSGKTLCYLLPMIELIAKQKELAETTVRGVVLVPTKALGAQVYHVAKAATNGTPISVVSCCGDTQRKEASSLVREVRLQKVSLQAAGGAGNLADDGDAPSFADALPRPGEAAEDDEAEDDLETLLRQAQHQLRSQRSNAAVTEDVLYVSRADIIIATPQRLLRHLGSTPGFTLKNLRMLVIDEADQMLTGAFTSFVSRIVRTFEESTELFSARQQHERQVLHKVLCSATLSAHTARISEIRLRNCRYFSLDTDGSTRAMVDAEVAETATGDISHVSSKFSLPPLLEEHVLAITKDEIRHAVLLKLLRAISTKRNEEAAARGEEVAHTERQENETPTALPPSSHTGQSIVVFCATGEVVRVLTKLLVAAGMPALEFTAMTTDTERRRAILSAVAGKPTILVTTDALMRGVDLPGVGYVVMYDAPRSLQQYVHRVGRTARALRRGHAYMILAKKGPSGTLQDGEVASFLALDRYLKREKLVTYEHELKRLSEEEVTEANELLQSTQRELQGMIRTALQRAAATTAVQKAAAAPQQTAAAASKPNNNNTNKVPANTNHGNPAGQVNGAGQKRPRDASPHHRQGGGWKQHHNNGHGGSR